MARHVTSDTHFGHGKMAEVRGFASVEAMNNSMIDSWNSRVRWNDEVYHLGDFSFMGAARTRDLIAELHGRIYLVPGNHDKGLNAGTLSFFAGVLKPIHELKETVHHPDGSNDVHRFVLCHFPMLSWNRMHHKAIHLHGHSHGSCIYPHPNNRIMDVGVDPAHRMGFGYSPIPLSHVLAVMGTRSFTTTDQHHERDDE